MPSHATCKFTYDYTDVGGGSKWGGGGGLLVGSHNNHTLSVDSIRSSALILNSERHSRPRTIIHKHPITAGELVFGVGLVCVNVLYICMLYKQTTNESRTGGLWVARRYERLKEDYMSFSTS